MKVTNITRKLAKSLGVVAVAGSMAIGGADSHAGVMDASFEDHNIDAHKAATGATVDYAYSADGGGWIDGYSPAAGGDSAWTSRESGLRAAWIYNTAYATNTNRSIPRTGEQAISGASGYTYQDLSDTFQPDTTYTFKIHVSDVVDDGGRFFLYIYDATVVTDGGDDADNQNFVDISFDHTADPGSWQEYSVSYSTRATGSEIGNNIGVSFWSSGNVFFDDASLMSRPVPEPTSLLLGLGGVAFAGLGLRRRN
ncbi:PEP-CTERM sorting domain-containing protein [Pirellulales bacterium]|nr:PEP-CTERM sorting domain-containing protein [Pirellulales bacterium]